MVVVTAAGIVGYIETINVLQTQTRDYMVIKTLRLLDLGSRSEREKLHLPCTRTYRLPKYLNIFL